MLLRSKVSVGLMKFAVAVFILALASGMIATNADATSTVLVLNQLPDVAYVGETIYFTGTLSSGGTPLAYKTIQICEDDPLWPDDCIAVGTTDQTGTYYIRWVVEEGTVEVDFDIYAEFDGDRTYSSDQTPRQTMSVVRSSGSITLDPIPESAAIGEMVTFTGTLHLDRHSPEGAIVYIKDEDTGSRDELLTSAYVNADGSFTTYWIAEDTDYFDNTIDIQAVFEGYGVYNRMATPIQGMYVYVDTTFPDPTYPDPTPPAPEPEPDPTLPVPTPPSSDGYMELYYSLDFDKAPLVAIVPSPDSYENVKKHIVPVREGILGLTSMLERQYPGGAWDVNFDVVMKGDKFGTKPDVIVNLVTREDKSGCDWDRFSGGTLGWANVSLPKPVPTTVCSLDGLTNSEIGATAVHEFVHAIGLGHTFNIPGDMLCSVEEDGPTCPGSSSESTRASELNLAALVKIYGTDGFQNPNNDITNKERFTLNGGQTESPQQRDTSRSENTQNSIQMEQSAWTIYTDSDQYKAGEVILVDAFYDGYLSDDKSFTMYMFDGVNLVDRFSVSVDDGYISDFFYGVDSPGVYHVGLYDDDIEDVVAQTTIDVVGYDDAVIYTDASYYSPGEEIYIEGFYLEYYEGFSSIEITYPTGESAEWIDVYVTDDYFDAYVDGLYLPGRYVVLLFDEWDDLAASTAFMVIDP